MSHEIWELAQEALRATGRRYHPSIEAFNAEEDLEWRDTFLVDRALAVEPEPLSIDLLDQWRPYRSRALVADVLAQTAARGLLVAEGDAYRLSDEGRSLVGRWHDFVVELARELRPLPPQETAVLLTILAKLVEASLSAPEPADKSNLLNSHFFDPGADAPPVARIRQFLGDLWNFRDDCHLASWQHHGVSGAGWEALTYVWRGQAETAAALAQALLPYRGHDEAAYADALRELIERGWMKFEDGRFQLTDVGRDVREDAERITDATFFAPWQKLDAGELEALEALLIRLRDGLQLDPV